MAFITLNYNSPTLGIHLGLNVILPEDESFFNPKNEVKPLKTVMLLHGLGSNAWSYTRFTSIERYADRHRMAIIMPNADHSAYANMTYGHSYYDYILEVYHYVHQILPLSQKREDNFIAGHSMGGYGTMKYALTQSQLFSKAAPMSAVFDAQTLIDLDWMDFAPKGIMGENTSVKGTELDTYHLVDEAVNKGIKVPELLIQCGTEDFLYQDNLNFIQYLEHNGIAYQFEESPGQHDYDYWDYSISRALEWFAEDVAK